MKESIKMGVILLVLCAVSAGLLAVVNGFTAPIIFENEMAETLQSYRDIFGEDAEEVTLLDSGKLAEIQEEYPDVDNIFEVKKGGELIGYGINIKATGFGGEMTNAIGFRIDGETIAGFRNISNQETKGFGSHIADESYYSSYNDKSAAGPLEISVDPQGENQVMQISGATVTSKAVNVGNTKAIEVFHILLGN